MYQNKNVIGLVGEIGAGKTFAAKYLVKNYKYTHMDFADLLRKATSVILDIDYHDIIHNRDLKEQQIPGLREGMTVRKFMQILGTEFARDLIDKDFWVKSLENRILKSSSSNIVIGDVRFQNEVDMIRDRFNGTIIRIERPNNPFRVAGSHSSEELWKTLTGVHTIVADDLEGLYNGIEGIAAIEQTFRKATNEINVKRLIAGNHLNKRIK